MNMTVEDKTHTDLETLSTFKKILFSVVLIGFGLIVSLFLIEILFRLSMWLAPQKPKWTDRPPFYFQAEASDTLQDYAHTDKKASDTFRIAVVGDSFTFAPYMQFTDAFPKVLERMLNLNKTGKHAEVINYGVPAYSTSHEIAKITKAIEQEADLIILQITLNDPEIKPYTPIGISVFDTFGQLKVTGFEKFVFDHWKTLGFVVTRLHNSQTTRDYTKYFNDLFFKEKTWNNFHDSLGEIARLTTTAKTPIVAVVFPLFGLPLDDKYPFHAIHQKVHGALEELKIPYLDLYKLYEGIPLDRLQVIPDGDRHPNEIAHRMAAETIYTWLTNEQALIPEELKIKLRFQGRTQIIKEKPYVD